MVDLSTTQLRRLPSRPSLQFLEALLLRKATQTPILTRTLNSFAHEKGVSPMDFLV